MKLKILTFILFSLFASCQHKTIDGTEIVEIDIAGAFENRNALNIMDISEDCEYILLESTDQSLIDKHFTIYCDDQYVIAICLKKILLFDRETGKFIRIIGTQGRGPDEYTLAATNMPYDEQKKVIYTRKNLNARYEYDLEGNLVSRKKGPDQVYDFINLNDKTFASFIDNYLGSEKRKIVIFNEQDSIINIFPNYQSFTKGSMVVFYSNSWFYKIDSQIFFCEKFNDTLFNITPTSLTPRFVLDKGSYSFPNQMRGDIIVTDNKGNFSTRDEYFLTEKVIESSRYLFYVFSYKKMIYTAVYDKKLQKTIVNDYIGDSGNGYINNIDNFIPLELSSITSKNDLICTIDAFKIKAWFDSYPEKSNGLSEHLQKLKNISETGNPVVIISKLKE